jgi:hypothetical protein
MQFHATLLPPQFLSQVLNEMTSTDAGQEQLAGMLLALAHVRK